MTSQVGEWTELPGGVLTSLSSVYLTRYLSALQQGNDSSDPRLADPANRAVDAELRAHLKP